MPYKFFTPHDLDGQSDFGNPYLFTIQRADILDAMRNHSSMLFILVCTFCCLFGCSCKSSRSEEEQVSEWLLRCPPTMNPSWWPPESFFYSTHNEWAEAGRKIEGIEDIIIDMYDNNSAPVHPHVICLALNCIGSSKSVSLLIRILEDKNQGFHAKWQAICALGSIGDTAAVDPLCRFVSSSERPSRKIGSQERLTLLTCAIAALGRIGDPKAIPVIEAGLKNPKLSESSKKFVLLYLEKLKVKQGTRLP